MITINEEDISKLEEIGSGKYGTVYRISDSIAYKIYHKSVKDKEGFYIKNPALKHAKRRLAKLKRKKDKLLYTDVLDDIIYIDGKIGGISIPYYDGCVLEDLRDSGYTLKRDVMEQLRRNHQELIDYYIYPHDYHLKNVMYVDNEVKIIDLDDPLTYSCIFPNFLSNLISSSRVNDVAYELFCDDRWFYNYNIKVLLDKKYNYNIDAQDWLDSYFEEKEKITDYLFIDKDSDISIIKSFIDSHQVRILLLVDRENTTDKDIIDILHRLANENIRVYELVDSNNIGLFTNNYPIRNKVLIKNNNIGEYHI